MHISSSFVFDEEALAVLYIHHHSDDRGGSLEYFRYLRKKWEEKQLMVHDDLIGSAAIKEDEDLLRKTLVSFIVALDAVQGQHLHHSELIRGLLTDIMLGVEGGVGRVYC